MGLCRVVVEMDYSHMAFAMGCLGGQSKDFASSYHSVVEILVVFHKGCNSCEDLHIFLVHNYSQT